ncbi:protein vein-like isoform X3 [Limulus polyphemus]|uniref:Protein vein-like isoform X3 n=1 Tax=Limulus polyphemus TaxID=6850 RepID=A0ABM1C602_LIMPO|nr:protein vein-like isoform X3 [Limulus polyphemus]
MRTCLVSWLVLTFLIAWCRWTAARTCLDDHLDAASKAHLAPIVFQGRLVKVSSVDKVAQFRVKRLYKSDANVALQQKNVVFLKFLNENYCVDTFREKELKQKNKYIVFAATQKSAQPGNPGNQSLVAVARPLRKNRKIHRTVRKVLCQGCAKPPSTRIRHAKVITQGNAEIKLRCIIRGNPQPKVQWYRNKILIRENKRIKIKTRRRKSVLIIKRVRRRDGGQYQCRASNILSPPSVSETEIIVQSKRHKNRRPCDVRSYCLNGGNCTMIESLQERVCECADGYKGLRCEHKDTTHTFDTLARSSSHSSPSNKGNPRSGSVSSVASRRRKIRRKSQKTVAPPDSVDIVATTKVLEAFWGK